VLRGGAQQRGVRRGSLRTQQGEQPAEQGDCEDVHRWSSTSPQTSPADDESPHARLRPLSRATAPRTSPVLAITREMITRGVWSAEASPAPATSVVSVWAEIGRAHV